MKYPSLSSLVWFPTHSPLPLKRSLSIESLSEQPNFQASIVCDPSLDPTGRLLAFYNYYLSSEEAIIFYEQAGKFIHEKLPKSSEVQQGVLQYFFDGGNIYPTVLVDYKASDWLLHSVLNEIAQDPIADPHSLEISQEHWEAI
ncbi:hypothetical protein AVEN_107636-1 [Araneus ventricosus]|uniref:Uncharacterized protein n=1 Tax=Araneus ventricosus TaxID=182803 RepID=A0A4Y2RH48_ARAVE|nr:hypothetical protein AVEN_107636-1 [Araneus ventricosus]